MKSSSTLMVFGLLLSISCLSPLVTEALAIPIDLDTFQSDAGIVPANGTMQFFEDISYSSISLYNDAFDVPTESTFLTFDYAFTLGDSNQDTLFVKINYTTYAFSLEESGTGHFQIDLSGFRGMTISLDFGLESSD